MKRTLWVCTAVLLVVSSFVQAALVDVVALQGKAVQYKNDTGVWVSETRLATRTAGVWGDDPASNTLDAKKSYLQFDISGIHGTITSAVLTVYSFLSNSDGKDYYIYGLKDGVNETWSADTIDWFSAPANVTNSGTAVDPSLTIQLAFCDFNADGVQDVSHTDVTAFVNQDTDGLVTFIFTAGGTAYMYNVLAGTYYDAQYVPVLSIEYIVPEPATLVLLGLGGLVSLRKSR
ncbi:MAG TPA: DNRLRE domain-containing protein [Anaerohalosphaeraceae bacterium]|nr:DNRLRE domain-containing protein [Anaerohalosphaeraceae bacterium]